MKQGKGAMVMTTQGNLQATDYMSPAYVERHKDEPSVQQKAEVERQLRGQAEITAEIKRVYPRWQSMPISIRMVKGSVGTVLKTGFDNALRAIAAGNAELVRP
jgi:hypothetical protein